MRFFKFCCISENWLSFIRMDVSSALCLYQYMYYRTARAR